MCSDSYIEPILKDIYAKLGATKSSTHNLSLPQDVKTEFEEIQNRLTALEHKVNDFQSEEQFARTALSKVTPVLEKIT